jgi:hypothetical protein
MFSAIISARSDRTASFSTWSRMVVTSPCSELIVFSIARRR